MRRRAGNAGSLGIGTRDVISIIGVAVAHDLGINVRTARLRMFHALEYQHASALAHHKAVAVCIERAASRRRIGVGGQCAAGRKACNGIGDNGRLGAAREDRVGIAVLEGVVPPTINYHTPDSACDLDYTPNRAVRADLTWALSTNLGFGGHNAAIALRRYTRS